MSSLKNAARQSGLVLLELPALLRRFFETIPAIGLIGMVPIRGQFRALLYSLITIVAGSIALWLAPMVSSFEHDIPVNAAAVFGRIAAASLKGELLILVPSLLAPLFLVIFALTNNKKMQIHQVGLFMGSILVAAASLLIYVTKIANNVADQNFLLHSSSGLAGLSFCLLYLYFLITYPSENIIPDVQSSGSSLTDDLMNLRRGEGR